METIKIPIHRTVTEEKEVNLPLYRKSSSHAYKIINQNTCIQVYQATGEQSGHIGLHHIDLAWHSADSVDCTEAEFLEAYNIELAKINAFVNQ